MKKLIALPLIGIVIMLSLAASPKAGSSYSCVWTNDGTFVYLVGQGVPNPNGIVAGPSFFFQTNAGSVFSGKYVGQDTSVPNNDTYFFPNHFSMVSSNETAGWGGRWAAADSENYAFYASGIISGFAGKDYSYAAIQLIAGTTNGHTSELEIGIVPNSPTVEMLRQYQNGVFNFGIGQDGVLEFGQTGGVPPSDPVTIRSWLDVRVGNQVLKLPLYQ